jgi:phenylacetate-coenzyme A ligase PaaK-like adenylate-forming protein
MTKNDMTANLDDVFTDRRLTRDRVERHLAATGTEPSYLLDEYTVLASGGSSGERATFVFGWDALVEYAAGLLRAPIGRLLSMGVAPDAGLPMAMVAAGSAVHASRCGAAIFGDGAVTMTSIPVTLPLREIVDRLNRLQPVILNGYPSALGLLAAEKEAGRLTISPMAITGNSEQFPPELRARLAAAFGVPVGDMFAATEGVVGIAAPGEEAIVVADDLAIVEPVDDENRPVGPGTPSSKVLVTNLFNLTQPLIRYELTDRFVRLPDAPDHGHLRVTVEGRQDDLLRWGDTTVHPLVVRSALVTAPDVAEYQVRQTDTGLDVAVVAVGTVDESGLAGRIADALERAGVPAPDVTVRVVDDVDRHPATGKARRFIPLRGESLRLLI